MATVYSPSYVLLIKSAGNIYWQIDTLLSANCTLVTQAGVGQATFSIADPSGFISEQVQPHAMQAITLWITNRWGQWGPAWAGYVDEVHRVSDPKQGELISVKATSPLKLWEISTLSSSYAQTIGRAYTQNVSASAVLQLSCIAVNYPLGLLTIDPVADSGSGIWPQGLQQAFVNPEAQTWSAVMQSLLANSGLEWFFDERGFSYWRQVGYHNAPVGNVYRSVLEEDIIQADLAESDTSVATTVEVRYNTGSSYTQYVSAEAQAPDAMIAHLRERRLVVYTPWIIDNKAAAQYLAEVLVEQYAANVLVGSVTIPADPYFQIGTVIDVPALKQRGSGGRSSAAFRDPRTGVTRYYLSSVTYQLQWNGPWTMTLGLSYGRAPGQSSPYMDGLGTILNPTTGRAVGRFNTAVYPKATYEDVAAAKGGTGSQLPSSGPLLQTDPRNPNKYLNPFTIVSLPSLPKGQVAVDPRVFPAARALRIDRADGSLIQSNAPGGIFVVVSSTQVFDNAPAPIGTVGSGNILFVNSSRDTVGYVTVIKYGAGGPASQPGQPATAPSPLGPPVLAGGVPTVPNGLFALTLPIAGMNPITGYTQGFGATGVGAESNWYAITKNPAYPDVAHFHPGVDIPASFGTPILSATPGTVLFWGWTETASGAAIPGLPVSEFGIVVVIQCGDYDFFYAHQADPSAYAQYRKLVSVGQSVTAGAQIGWVDSTGNVQPPGPAGAHLHFGLFHCANGPHFPKWDMSADEWVDPTFYLQGQAFDPYS